MKRIQFKDWSGNILEGDLLDVKWIFVKVRSVETYGFFNDLTARVRWIPRWKVIKEYE